MSPRQKFSRSVSMLAAFAATLSLFSSDVQAKSSETLLYSFSGGRDGGQPYDSLLRDSAGNLYGTTSRGGHRAGTVFKLAPDGEVTVLHTFVFGQGFMPFAPVTRDTAGNLYGTTTQGGRLGSVVFKLAPDGTETVLHAFSEPAGGEYLTRGVLRNSRGIIYGASEFGGGGDAGGVVYRLSPDGKETILHSFATGTDGAVADTSLITDGHGGLYGVTRLGGGTDCYGGSGCGTLFKVDVSGKESVLYAFKGGDDGTSPDGGLVMDDTGALYGATVTGGKHNAGTLFRLVPNGALTVLHTFTGGWDGGDPNGRLYLDKGGAIYGTTYQGGGACNCGVAFELSPGKFRVLHAFGSGSDGQNPGDGLITDGKGNFYGTTINGGAYDFGTVFKLTPN